MDSESVSVEQHAQTHDDISSPAWMRRVPMVTGILAGLAGFLTVRSANMSNQAIYNSNQAVFHQALASDHWAEYQADSVKRHIDDTALRVGVADSSARKALEAESQELLSRQSPLKDQAKAEATLRAQELSNGTQKLATKDMLDYAGVAAQLGIALASVAALTKKKAAFNAGVIAGIIATVVTTYAMVEPYLAGLLKH